VSGGNRKRPVLHTVWGVQQLPSLINGSAVDFAPHVQKHQHTTPHASTSSDVANDNLSSRTTVESA
jgi:hypothetical protein